MEQWKQVVIDGIEYNYEVSDMGNVRNVKSGRVLKPQDNRHGYLVIDLYKNGKRKRMRVHRLVALMFIPNPQNLETVNHKNEIKTDNRVDNLEWMTNEENIRYSDTNSKKVMGYSLTNTKVIVFHSMTQAQRFGFDNSNICNCCNGKLKRYKGYKWKYIN